MISLCQDRLPDPEWMVADMRRLRLRRRFDGVLALGQFLSLEPRQSAPHVCTNWVDTSLRRATLSDRLK
jgi:hypothetical protein